MNSRVTSQKVQNLFVAVNVDEIPPLFADTFTSNLSALLSAHGVRNEFVSVSDLDLSALNAAQIKRFDYVLACKPSQLSRSQAAYLSVTMTCALTEMKTRTTVMKAAAKANKGFGLGFGKNEAEHVTVELVSKMEQAGLIGVAEASSKPEFYAANLHSTTAGERPTKPMRDLYAPTLQQDRVPAPLNTPAASPPPFLLGAVNQQDSHGKDLLDLAFILGKHQALRQLCVDPNDQTPRDRMARIVVTENANPSFSRQLSMTFNSGYRAATAEFATCSMEGRAEEARLSAQEMGMSPSTSGMGNPGS